MLARRWTRHAKWALLSSNTSQKHVSAPPCSITLGGIPLKKQ